MSNSGFPVVGEGEVQLERMSVRGSKARALGRLEMYEGDALRSLSETERSDYLLDVVAIDRTVVVETE
jgi:hypothetical protein